MGGRAAAVPGRGGGVRAVGEQPGRLVQVSRERTWSQAEQRQCGPREPCTRLGVQPMLGDREVVRGSCEVLGSRGTQWGLLPQRLSQA